MERGCVEAVGGEWRGEGWRGVWRRREGANEEAREGWRGEEGGEGGAGMGMFRRGRVVDGGGVGMGGEGMDRCPRNRQNNIAI